MTDFDKTKRTKTHKIALAVLCFLVFGALLWQCNASVFGATTATFCTNKDNHYIDCGNIGKWFSSKDEVGEYYSSVVSTWIEKRDNGTITDEEYYASVPVGYECWSCSNCGKWTGNFKYR